MSGLEFDEKAAIEEVCRGIYFEQADFDLSYKDIRLTPDRVVFIKGARYQHSQDAAKIAELEALVRKSIDMLKRLTADSIVIHNQRACLIDDLQKAHSALDGEVKS